MGENAQAETTKNMTRKMYNYAVICKYGYMKTIVRVESTSEARTALPSHLKTFAEQGEDAAPVIIGRQRKAEAVLISIDAYERLLEVEEMFVIEQARRRLAEGGGIPFADVVAEFGFEGQVV